MNQAHIDLRYVLAGLGYRGGLKQCERQLGLDRGELDEVGGFFAVLLWQDYKERGNRRALDTLLAYNTLDMLNVAQLMTLGYNLKVQTRAVRSQPPNVRGGNPGKPVHRRCADHRAAPAQARVVVLP